MNKYELLALQKAVAYVSVGFPILKKSYEQWSKIYLLDESWSSGKDITWYIQFPEYLPLRFFIYIYIQTVTVVLLQTSLLNLPGETGMWWVVGLDGWYSGTSMVWLSEKRNANDIRNLKEMSLLLMKVGETKKRVWFCCFSS